MQARPVIRKLKLPMVSMFHDQYIRPITVDTSNSMIVNQLEEATNGFSTISASSIAELAPSIIKPKATATTKAYIQNGYQEKRFRFFMEVELTKTPYSATYCIVTGFSDYIGATPSGAIDPNMRLYFNNIVQYTDNNVNNNVHGYSSLRRTTQNNSQLIQPVTHASMSAFSSRVRAQDVISNMAVLDVTDEDPFVANTIGTMTTPAQASRARQLPSVYISNVLNAAINAGQTSSSQGNILENPEHVYYKEMIGSLRESSFTVNPFLSLLSMRTGYMTSGSVTWGELAALFPEITLPDVTEVTFVRGNLIDYRTTTDHNRGMGLENQAAAIVQNILPAIMSMNMIHHATFTLTNETFDGFPQYIPGTIVPMTDKVNVQLKLNTFGDQLVKQLAPALAGGHGCTFMLQVSANILTEAVMTITVNRGTPLHVAIPLYADSVSSCVGYAQRSELDQITHELSSLINGVSAATGMGNDFTERLLDPLDPYADSPDPIYMGGVRDNINNYSDPLNNPATIISNANLGTGFVDDPLAILR